MSSRVVSRARNRASELAARRCRAHPSILTNRVRPFIELAHVNRTPSLDEKEASLHLAQSKPFQRDLSRAHCAD